VGRIIVVSNRVGSLANSPSNSGGLAIAMRAALQREPAIWFGWSGNIVETPPESARIIREGSLTRALVDLSQQDYQRYYAGFANRALWPLFHYRIDLVEFDPQEYSGYSSVNRQFANQLLPLLRPDDLIWVHDYHLIPLGAFLRERGCKNRIGFFFHTPFPVTEVITTLPVHEDLFRALSNYDLVGFQTDNDLHAFTDYIAREVGGDVERDGRIRVFGRNLRAAAFPISIDPEATAVRAARAMAMPGCQRLEASLSGRSLVIGVDRLDYSKGLLRRFQAIDQLLESHPDYRQRVVVLQIATPTRGDVPEYRQLRASLDAIMGRINGRFGEPDLLPVRYLNRNFSQDTLFGFYRISAVGLVTPLRDGMNLVAKEFVASQDPEDPGVLVLSRFAGAARELEAAVIVNPYDSAGIAAALDRALSMPKDERRERHAAQMKVLRGNDIHTWRNAFLTALGGPAYAHTGAESVLVGAD
jgi:trehalose 6-phosphate synthase